MRWPSSIAAALGLGLTVISLSLASAARAQVADVVIDVDSTVRLICLSPLEFVITPADLSNTYAGGAGADSAQTLIAGPVSATAQAGSLEVALPPITAPLTGDPTRHRLTQVGCLIEANASSGRVDVSIALTGNTILTGPGGSQVTVRSVTGRRFGSGGAFGSAYSYPAWFHFFADTLIEFQIEVDLSTATHEGLYSSVFDGNFTVEVTAP